jgi:hypothetical protein
MILNECIYTETQRIDKNRLKKFFFKKEMNSDDESNWSGEELETEVVEQTPLDASKSRKEQKALLLERKSQKPNAPLIQQAKKIWEQLRQKKLESKERMELMTQMMKLVKGKCQDVLLFTELSNPRLSSSTMHLESFNAV